MQNDRMIKNNHHLVWDYFVITVFLITSGSVCWVHVLSPALTFMFFLFVALYNAVYVRKNIGKANNNSFRFIFIIILLCILNYLYINSPYKDNSMVGYIVALTGAYLIISRYDFYYFRRILTNILYYISLIGIPIFILAELEALPLTIITTLGGTEYSTFLFYTLGWPYLFHRYSGIWHEPGACQIIYNTVLWLHFDCITNWKWERGQKKKLLVILLGSILTLSTGSYLVLMLLVIGCVLSMRIRSKRKILIITGLLIVSSFAIFIIFNSPVIQNKLFDAEGENGSKIARISDALALWTMTLEQPILGYGIGTEIFWKLSEKYGNTACSSGLLTYSASLGFTWLFVFIYCVYKNVKRLKIGIGAYFLIFAVLMMQFNEKFIEFPITNIFVFQFASYLNKKNNVSK